MIRKNKLSQIVRIAFLMLFCRSLVFAQIDEIITSVTIGNAIEKQPLSVTIQLRDNPNISSVFIAYKPFGQNEFIKKEMLITANNASILISADNIKPPFIEYYFIVEFKDGSTKTYPSGINQGESPFQVNVKTISVKDSGVIILTPNNEDEIVVDDFILSISFIKAADDVDINATKIFLNNVDFSSKAVKYGDLLLFNANDLLSAINFGNNIIRIEIYNKEGKLYDELTRNFKIVSKEQIQSAANNLSYSGTLRIEGRNEVFNDISKGYENFSADLYGYYGNWSINGNVYITNEEKKFLQPLNRFYFGIRANDFLKIQLGDVYPKFPTLILDGKRIRGFSGELNLGFFNIQTTFGEITRAIEGSILQKYTSINVPLESNIIAINESKYGASFAKVNLGTYSRSLFAIRPSFDFGENFQWGFSYLHSKDDPTSIEFGARPKENAVFGSDLNLFLDNQNFIISAQAALSIINNDISTGTLSDAQIDSVFGANSFFDINPNLIKDIKNILGRFITVNQYIGPLNPAELSSLGAEVSTTLNYFANTLKWSYIYRGNDYVSFGQNFLRTDVKGINLFDRVRLFDNQLFVSIGYENLSDNLQKTKVATTNYITYSSSISYFPHYDLPNISVSFFRYKNNNGLNINDTVYGKYAVDDITNRFSLSAGFNFKWKVRHNASFSLSTSNREDNSITNADAKYTSAGFTINSSWLTEFSSTINVFYYTSKVAHNNFNYVTLSLGGKYRIINNKLELIATLSPSFGDFKRQALDFSATYNVIPNVDFIFQMRYYKVAGQSANTIVGLTSRLTI
ncbi:hypothetical protein ABRY23_07865 [Melioribacteraceae bacterium 4301-Me]|uniref:hypothetical protein n=1 Tax=Pyranulibacter aquaticus TaxID=3163344 RepID=UPI00359B5844